VGSATTLPFNYIAALGIRRVSVGGALARAAWGGFMQAARSLKDQQSFSGFGGAPAHAELDGLFTPADVVK